MDIEALSDEELLERCSRGDDHAFRVLFERLRQMVYNLVFRILNSHLDAEEVTPEVFVRVWQKAGDFRGGSRVSTWVYRIAANMALDRVRAGRNVHEVFWEDLPPRERAMPDERDSVESPEDAVLRREQATVLERAMARLNVEDRLLVTLYHLQECSYQEVQQITGINPANIKSKLFRARRRLRGILIEMEKGETQDDVPEGSTSSAGLYQASTVSR